MCACTCELVCQAAFTSEATDHLSAASIRQLFASFACKFQVPSEQVFLTDLECPEVLTAAKESQRRGIALQTWSTPTFVVNGTEMPSLGSRVRAVLCVVWWLSVMAVAVAGCGRALH